ncbi:IQ domain-containing protein N [Octodon degus]|uniref:IQ domain-containing protein N n=1 Tax=Octodon degus TaxID=10160 RepID=A0A6P6DS89_OCTDE|nr:IQ domain-containing protein N [Octodon degus]
MQQAAQLPVTTQLSPSGHHPLQPQLTSNPQDGATGKPAPQPQQALPSCEKPLPQQPVAPHYVPRLRAVVESQAFKNILVDEMDMMHARAATLIQANWRGHRLRQKLVSQMTAAKAIQEAWRRFSTRRLRRTSRMRARVHAEEGDIPYHPPQQVRFGPQPVTVSEDMQVPASVTLEPYAPRLCLLPPPTAQGPPASGLQAPCAPMGVILLHQAMAGSLQHPRSLDPRCQPCVLTTTVRSPCLISGHVVADAVKSRRVTSRTTKVGAPEPHPSRRHSQAASGALRAQAHMEAELPRTLSQTCDMVGTARGPAQTYPRAAPTRPPAQIYPAPTLTRTQPQTCPAPTPTKARDQALPTPLASPPPPSCPEAPDTRVLPQVSPLASVMKAHPQTHPAAPGSRIPPQQGSVPEMTRTSPPVHPVTAPVRSPPQATQAAMLCKTPSQTGPMALTPKPPPQMRLAAMITRTPAQIRSIAAALKTLCPTLPATRNFKAAPPATVPSSSSNLHLTTSRTKVPTNTRQATAWTVNVSDLSCWAERRVKGVPQPHLETGAPGAPTRGSLEAKKTHAGTRKLVSKDSASKTNVATQAARAPPWARVTKDKGQPPSQPPRKTDAIKVQSQVLMPVQVAVALPQAQVAVPLTKALAPGQPAKVPAQPQGATCPAASSHVHPPTEQVKALSQPHLATCPTKAPSPARHVTCLTRTQSQAQLLAETARRLHAAQPSADLGSKAQSHPMLTRPKESTPCCQLPGTRVKQDHRPGKATQGTRPTTVLEPQGTLVPLLTAATATYSSCSVESWGDSSTTRAQLPTPSQATPGQEDMLASQITALCTELVTALGSQEDLRVLLTKALSQGEVWAALTQVLSKEARGATVTKALPQGMLGLVLAKALSWGELGTTLSRALSRGELRTELAKAVHGRVAEVLRRALTQEERAVLSQALSQGKLGAILCQSLSRAAPRTGAVLPKATSKVTSSKMPLPPAPAQVTAWGPCVHSPAWQQPSKGPVDTSTRGGRPWTSAVPSVAVRPLDHAVAPHTPRQPARVLRPWDHVGPTAVSMQHVEKIFVWAATVIQACARGYLVRRTIKVWHQRANVIQATWRGHCVRRNLAQLYRATIVIQAAWRGHCVRRARAQHMQLPPAWTEPGGETKAATEHRCFQSCQPRACSLCRSLSPSLGSPPSVVMLVGASPRTCHTCGHTLPTRVVHGTGRACASHPAPQHPAPQRLQQPWDGAATTIQSAWRGFRVRRQLREQHSAARMLQATWRGHYTRSCLTPEALLGTGSPWDSAPGAPRQASRQPLRRTGV